MLVALERTLNTGVVESKRTARQADGVRSERSTPICKGEPFFQHGSLQPHRSAHPARACGPNYGAARPPRQVHNGGGEIIGRGDMR